MTCPICRREIKDGHSVCPVCSGISGVKKDGIAEKFRRIFCEPVGTVLLIATVILFALSIIGWIAGSAGESLSKMLLTVFFGRASKRNTELTEFILMILFNLPMAFMTIGAVVLRLHCMGKANSTGLTWIKAGAITGLIYSAFAICIVCYLTFVNFLIKKSGMYIAGNAILIAVAVALAFRLFYQILMIRFCSSANYALKENARSAKPSMPLVVLNIVNAVVGCVCLFVILVSGIKESVFVSAVEVMASLSGIVLYIFFAAVILKCRDAFSESDCDVAEADFYGYKEFEYTGTADTVKDDDLTYFTSEAPPHSVTEMTESSEMTKYLFNDEPMRKPAYEPEMLEGYCDRCGKRLKAGEMCSCMINNADLHPEFGGKTDFAVLPNESFEPKEAFEPAPGRLKSTMRTGRRVSRDEKADIYTAKKYFKKTSDIE